MFIYEALDGRAGPLQWRLHELNGSRSLERHTAVRTCTGALTYVSAHALHPTPSAFIMCMYLLQTAYECSTVPCTMFLLLPCVPVCFHMGGKPVHVYRYGYAALASVSITSSRLLIRQYLCARQGQVVIYEAAVRKKRMRFFMVPHDHRRSRLLLRAGPPLVAG